ncbi:efflux RND transporter permease subunit [Treponema primitia]|uniref:efflux RND transporter permease subunit n=1 Tax=Treponema primitia TaxID=88058 RepID=UPI00397FA900
MALSESVVKRPVLWLVVFVLISIVGVYLFGRIAVDLLPKVDIPMVAVSTVYPGAGPETVEKTLTKPLESALVNVSGVKKITSVSQENLSMIQLEFNYGVNLSDKVNAMRDKIDGKRRDLPVGAESPVIQQMGFDSMPMLRLAIQGERSQNELRRIAEDMIQSRLEQIDGVASTSVQGGQEQIVRVELSQNRLEAYGLTITGIAGALASQNIELGAGSIMDAGLSYQLRTSGEYATVAAIGETMAARTGDTVIRLQDLGTVKMGYRDERSSVFINGEEGVYVSITKQSGANSVTIADLIYERIEEIEKTLPQDVSIKIIEDETDMIRGMINELVGSALMGGALAVFILLLFLRNIRSTLIISISIPVSILATFGAMSLAGLTINIITLVGLILGVGMIVDSSIVVLENIYHYRELGEDPRTAAIKGTGEVVPAIISSTLTTLCVFIPIILFKNGLAMIGQTFQDMIFTLGISLTVSLAVAVFLVPVLASHYLPIATRTQKPLRNRALKTLDAALETAITGITRGYGAILQKAVNHRLVTVLLVIAAFAGSLLAFTRMNIVMDFQMVEDTMTLEVELPLGTPYKDTRAAMLRLQDIALLEIKGVKNIVTNVGTSDGMMGGGSNTGSLTVLLDLAVKGGDTGDTVERKLRAHYDEFPGALFTVSADDGFGEEYDVDISLHYDELDSGLAAAKEITGIIKQHVPSVGDLTIDLTEGIPQVEIVINRYRAYEFGLNVATIASEIYAAMNGIDATTYRAVGDEYTVTLFLRESDRSKLPDLDLILIPSDNGQLIPLANFASLEKSTGPINVKRENQSRIIHITGMIIDGSRADEVNTAIDEALATNFVMPDGVTLSFGGTWKETMEMLTTLGLVLSLAALLVFGVMAAQYESFKGPLINICTIPLIIIGVVLIYLVTGKTMDMFTMIAIIMLSGMVVNTGIVLVDYTNQLVRGGMPVRAAVVKAGESRFRPVLMSTLTTIIGLVPMSFFPGVSSQMIQPLGLTVVGGLGASTVITLFFIPVLYSLVNEGRRKSLA